MELLVAQENQCIIGRIGLETEVETQFLLILHPKEFFLDLAMESEPKRIWFSLILVQVYYAQFFKFYNSKAKD